MFHQLKFSPFESNYSIDCHWGVSHIDPSIPPSSPRTHASGRACFAKCCWDCHGQVQGVPNNTKTIWDVPNVFMGCILENGSVCTSLALSHPTKATPCNACLEDIPRQALWRHERHRDVSIHLLQVQFSSFNCMVLKWVLSLEQIFICNHQASVELLVAGGNPQHIEWHVEDDVVKCQYCFLVLKFWNVLAGCPGNPRFLLDSSPADAFIFDPLAIANVKVNFVTSYRPNPKNRCAPYFLFICWIAHVFPNFCCEAPKKFAGRFPS